MAKAVSLLLIVHLVLLGFTVWCLNSLSTPSKCSAIWKRVHTEIVPYVESSMKAITGKKDLPFTIDPCSSDIPLNIIDTIHKLPPKTCASDSGKCQIKGEEVDHPRIQFDYLATFVLVVVAFLTVPTNEPHNNVLMLLAVSVVIMFIPAMRVSMSFMLTQGPLGISFIIGTMATFGTGITAFLLGWLALLSVWSSAFIFGSLLSLQYLQNYLLGVVLATIEIAIFAFNMTTVPFSQVLLPNKYVMDSVCALLLWICVSFVFSVVGVPVVMTLEWLMVFVIFVRIANLFNLPKFVRFAET